MEPDVPLTGHWAVSDVGRDLLLSPPDTPDDARQQSPVNNICEEQLVVSDALAQIAGERQRKNQGGSAFELRRKRGDVHVFTSKGLRLSGNSPDGPGPLPAGCTPNTDVTPGPCHHLPWVTTQAVWPMDGSVGLEIAGV
ncbi:hypothetical protein DPEC_G00137530 [Dallia pectoralis]|uniref:Uncharacterized protein n=1 Tax=Dallia pectoralis TaxID=75939 RepID=A0ACC2GLD5_DALPE|nr:hypothetical protein DPEC_G00137530 [Dallia pectoralis]